jgi:hypothetical protein
LSAIAQRLFWLLQRKEGKPLTPTWLPWRPLSSQGAENKHEIKAKYQT